MSSEFKMCGDTAKLREALEELMKFTCNSCERRLCEDDAEEEDGKIVSSPCSAIIGARNALSAPPRNCDRFADETDAQIAFLREVWLIGVSNLDRDPFDGWTNEMKSAYSKWLFAPATEKEGESDEKK